MQLGSETFTGLFHITPDMDTNESPRETGHAGIILLDAAHFLSYILQRCRSIMHERGVSVSDTIKRLAWWKEG